jgi:hypothetical protein
MTTLCRNTAAELAHNPPFVARTALLDRFDKRTEVQEQAAKLLDGKPVRIELHGYRYTLDRVLEDTASHKLYHSAAMSAYRQNPLPMRDLMRRVAQWAVCQYLFPDEADQLGFMY